jgi:hypothetical protein
MLSNEDTNLIKDAVYGMIYDHTWRPERPFTVFRLKDAAVERGYLSRALADRDGSDAAVEMAVDSIIQLEVERGRLSPIEPFEPIAGRSRWRIIEEMELLARRYIAAGGANRYVGNPFIYQSALDSELARAIWDREIDPLPMEQRTKLYTFLE